MRAASGLPDEMHRWMSHVAAACCFRNFSFADQSSANALLCPELRKCMSVTCDGATYDMFFSTSRNANG